MESLPQVRQGSGRRGISSFLLLFVSVGGVVARPVELDSDSADYLTQRFRAFWAFGGFVVVEDRADLFELMPVVADILVERH